MTQNKEEEIRKEIEEIRVLIDKFAERVVNKKDIMSKEEKEKWKFYLMGEGNLKTKEAELKGIQEGKQELLKDTIPFLDESQIKVLRKRHNLR